jgi:hypothetical protein
VLLFTDPTRRTYRALGFRRSVRSALGWSALRNIWRGLRAGSRQRGLKGDAWQQGGVIIVLPSGSVPYRFASRVSGDHPVPSEIVAVLHQVIGQAEPTNALRVIKPQSPAI